MLVSHIIDSLKGKGISCIELDATEEGKPLYEKFGFKTQNRIVTLVKAAEKAKTTAEPLLNPCLLCQKDDLEQVIEMDKKAFGSSRRFYLERVFQCERIFVAKQEQKVTGFILTTLGENGIRIGAWRSENGQDAERLIQTVTNEFSQKKQTIYIPLQHAQALNLVDKLGFKVDYESDQMRLGGGVGKNR